MSQQIVEYVDTELSKAIATVIVRAVGDGIGQEISGNASSALSALQKTWPSQYADAEQRVNKVVDVVKLHAG